MLTCKQPQYASLPSGQIMPAPADRGWHRFGEFFYRVNHANGPSCIKLVTPLQGHNVKNVEVCRHRAVVYKQALQRHPRRYSPSTRCWRQPEIVWINQPPDDLDA